MSGVKNVLIWKLNRRLYVMLVIGIKNISDCSKVGIPINSLLTVIKNQGQIEMAYVINQFKPARK